MTIFKTINSTGQYVQILKYEFALNKLLGVTEEKNVCIMWSVPQRRFRLVKKT